MNVVYHKENWQSFQRTYEELKRGLSGTLPEIRKRFQRTYEELKHKPLTTNNNDKHEFSAYL